MRKPVLFALAAVIVLLIAATGVLYSLYHRSTLDYADMKTAEQETRTHYADAVNSIAEIQDSLNAIVLGDAAVSLRSKQLGAEQRMTGPQREEALERVALVKASLERTKDKIRNLESGLKKSGVKIAGLQKMIANLKQTTTEKEEVIAQLTTQVNSLQTQVSGLEVAVQKNQEQIATQEQTIEEKRRELGTIYYVVGTKKELANSGIIVAKGGVLGLGKTVAPSGRFNETLFAALDTDLETVVRTPSTKPAKAVVLSAQPPESYTLQVVDGHVELHITDPKEFRKVKHLVIMTT